MSQYYVFYQYMKKKCPRKSLYECVNIHKNSKKDSPVDRSKHLNKTKIFLITYIFI